MADTNFAQNFGCVRSYSADEFDAVEGNIPLFAEFAAANPLLDDC